MTTMTADRTAVDLGFDGQNMPMMPTTRFQASTTTIVNRMRRIDKRIVKGGLIPSERDRLMREWHRLCMCLPESMRNEMYEDITTVEVNR